MSAVARPPRPRQRRRVPRRPRRRSPRAGSRSSTSRAATSRSRTRTARASSSRTARSTTTRSCAASSSARATRFRTHGDTEVHRAPLRAARRRLRRGGCAACSRSRSGTRARRRLVLARDRFGIKPLYYRDAGGELAFASELRALPRGEIDLDALEAFLAFNSIPAPYYDLPRRSASCPPGTCSSGRTEARPASSATRVPAPCRPTSCAPTTRPSSSRSCARGCATPCARTCSPTCPSACCSRAASTRPCSPRSRRRRRQRARCRRSRSASRSAASTSAATRGSSPSATARTTTSCSCGPTPRCCCRRSPTRSTSRSPTRRRCRRTSSRSSRREHVKVALSGEGGDELFGGYYTYAADLLADRVGAARAARAPARRAAAELDARRRASTTRRSGSCAAAHLPPLERHHGWKEIFSPDAARRADRRHARRSTRSTSTARATRETEGADPLARLQDVDFGIYLVDDLLVKTDRASMAHSLEARVPFLDSVVTNFALRAADEAQGARALEEGAAAQGGRAAAAARGRARAQARLLDPRRRVAARRARAVRARDALAGDAARARGSSSPTPVTRLLDEHVAGSEDCSRQLWGLLAFTLWYERHVEQSRRPARWLGIDPQRQWRRACVAERMKVWIDMTASAHVLVFRPLIEIMRGARRRGRDHGARLRADAAAARAARPARRGDRPARRPLALAEGAADDAPPRRAAAAGRSGRDFDVALAHGSHELTMTARRLGIPSSTTFDYEFATLQHQLGCRAATKVVVPEAIPPERLAPYGVAPAEARPVPGPEGGVLPLGLRARPRRCSTASASTRRACSSCCARRRTSRSTTGTRTRSSR